MKKKNNNKKQAKKEWDAQRLRLTANMNLSHVTKFSIYLSFTVHQ